MAVVIGQMSIPGSATVPAFTIPSGPCSVTWYSLSVQAIFLGTSNQVSSVNGLNCHSVPTSMQGYMTSKGSQIWATTGNATAATLNYAIITDQ